MLEKEIAQDIDTEVTARIANAPDLWDKHWDEEGDESWRAEALKNVYHRASQLVGNVIESMATGSVSFSGERRMQVVDIGGGRGLLADKLWDDHKPNVALTVVDHSGEALKAAATKGHKTLRADLEADYALPYADLYLCTETLEHLSHASRHRLLGRMTTAESTIISVPNDRLGPDEEPQHTIKFNAMSLKRELRQFWGEVRIEVMGPYLFAVCGALAEKNFTLSVCLPVRDEAHDLERTLASFRAVADEMVVGVDPRTVDNTFEIATKYADVVFFMEAPQGVGPKGDMGENGINFSHVRNQVAEKCTSEWIFMTEGHERLQSGRDVLLNLDKVIPSQARVGFVFREGNNQRWMFPWLYRNYKGFTWKRPVHNVLDFPEGTYAVHLVQISTLHERHDERGASRRVQRIAQNRRQLMDDWQTEKNVNSLFYLGQEWREMDPRRAIERLDQFLALSNNGVQKYQARLILAKESMRAGKNDAAHDYLMGCVADDWSRTEHWVWLGDIAFTAGENEKAYKFYMYAATTIGTVPMTMWWVDLCYYSYVPAQRLAMVCGELGRIGESLEWAKRVRELLPTDSPPEAFDEADSNIALLTEALDEATSGQPG